MIIATDISNKVLIHAHPNCKDLFYYSNEFVRMDRNTKNSSPRTPQFNGKICKLLWIFYADQQAT